MTDLEERILDLALEEIVGGQAPPDVRARVLAGPRPPRERWRKRAMLAAAVTIVSAVLWVVVQDETPAETRKWIQLLGADDEVDREAAIFNLKELGKDAQEDLRKATRDKNPAIAKQAGILLRRLEIQERLTPALRRAFPHVEDRLAANEEAWLMVLRMAVEEMKLSAARGEKPRLGREDLEALAAPAVRGAITELQKHEACMLVVQHRLRSATPETARLLKDAGLRESLAPVLRTTCMNNLSALWRHQQAYARRFGRMPKETGPEFWRALTTSQPALLPADSELLTCPSRFLTGQAGPVDYWGPKGDVEPLGEGEPVGLCDDPSHGNFSNILLKSGDLLSWARQAPMTEGARAKLVAPR